MPPWPNGYYADLTCGCPDIKFSEEFGCHFWLSLCDAMRVCDIYSFSFLN